MAKKNLSAKKSPLQVDDAVDASLETGTTPESAASVTHEDETPPAKAKAKAIDDSSSLSLIHI